MNKHECRRNERARETREFALQNHDAALWCLNTRYSDFLLVVL